MEAEQPLYYHMHVRTIIFYLSLTLCGQLGSSNHSALFILTNNLSLTHSLLTLVFFTYDSALSFLVSFIFSCNMCAVLHRTMWYPSTYRYGAFK